VAILAGLWIRSPTGPFEPWIASCTAILAVLEFIRRSRKQREQGADSHLDPSSIIKPGTEIKTSQVALEPSSANAEAKSVSASEISAFSNAEKQGESGYEVSGKAGGPSLDDLVQLAKSLDLGIDREAHLEELIPRARCANQVAKAIEIADSLSLAIDRDQAYRTILDYCLKNRRRGEIRAYGRTTAWSRPPPASAVLPLPAAAHAQR
jgi:hypothetical protein